MKIVKMHKGSREAFDDFLEQSLNEVSIDDDLANKYFADMNLPVPVIPAASTSFFYRNKYKLSFITLLFITSITSIIMVNIKSHKQHDNNLAQTKSSTEIKKSYTIDTNNTLNNNNNIVSNSDNNIKKQEGTSSFVIKKNTISNIPTIENKNDNSLKTIANNAITDVFVINNKINKVKKTLQLENKTILSKEVLIDSMASNVKEIFAKVKTATNNKLEKDIIKNAIKVDKQVAIKTADSLYIIW